MKKRLFFLALLVFLPFAANASWSGISKSFGDAVSSAPRAIDSVTLSSGTRSYTRDYRSSYDSYYYSYRQNAWDVTSSGSGYRSYHDEYRENVWDVSSSYHRTPSNRVYFDGSLTVIQPSGGTPSLRGAYQHPDELAARIQRPVYRVNHAHVKGRTEFDRRKTPEPSDSEKVYNRSIKYVTAKGKQGNVKLNVSWYGKNDADKYYKFVEDNAGGAHFTKVVKPKQVPKDVKRQLDDNK